MIVERVRDAPTCGATTARRADRDARRRACSSRCSKRNCSAPRRSSRRRPSVSGRSSSWARRSPRRGSSRWRAAAVVALAAYLFFSRTRFGLAVRAHDGRPTVARLMGIPGRPRATRFAWITAGALAGLAAALLGPAFGGLTPFAMTKFSLRAARGRGHRRPRLDLGRDRRQPARRRARSVRRRPVREPRRRPSSRCWCWSSPRSSSGLKGCSVPKARGESPVASRRRRRHRRGDRRIVHARRREAVDPRRRRRRPRSRRSASTCWSRARASFRSRMPRSSASEHSPRSTSAAGARPGGCRSSLRARSRRRPPRSPVSRRCASAACRSRSPRSRSSNSPRCSCSRARTSPRPTGSSRGRSS